jgi:hypothetical protein
VEHDKQVTRHKNAERVHGLEAKIASLEKELLMAQRQAETEKDYTIAELQRHI